MTALTATMKGPRCSACLLQLTRTRPYATHAPKGRPSPARPPANESTTTAPKSVKSPLTEMLDIFVPLTHAQKASIAHHGTPKQPRPPKKRPTPPPPSPTLSSSAAKTTFASATSPTSPHKPVQPPPAHAPKDNAGRSTSKDFRAVLDSVLPAEKAHPTPSPTSPKVEKKVEAESLPVAVARAKEKTVKERTIFESYLVIPAATRLKIWLAVGAFAALGLYVGDRLVPEEDDAPPEWAGRRAPPPVSRDAAGRDRVVEVGR
ncbi:hypothetical protein NBRC10512_000518 [Rhodotorula toruloides]|uniref:RHTO0S04e12970g1_1 n=2 Tax=Rhodotorula toruloides TaxID=5286 RepID=A0A061AR45_RHOTO|nr:uncharacterized protein RHTO_05998 [Rhodotorula toruloides NP11]EMS18467.1 hypothetical protein RHTO_05998 [Rhodotorula toruloides NP11]CDR39993.1 RHTO0S04e12970g1_1 [Rhodotorula toruloides]